MNVRHLCTFLLLCSLPLVVGAKCAATFSSGGSTDEDEPREGLVIVVREGELVGATAAPVAGIGYRSRGIAGVTDASGRFEYEPGARVRFFLGDIALGRELPGKARITPMDLVEGGSPGHPGAINIARLLASLDRQPGDGVITIPAAVSAGAVADSEALHWAVASINFDDETGFVNAASALVAVLTRDYPFTAVLADGAPLRDALAAIDDPPPAP